MPFEYRLRRATRAFKMVPFVKAFTRLSRSLSVRVLPRQILLRHIGIIRFVDRVSIVGCARGTSRRDGVTNVNRRLFLDICFPVDCKLIRKNEIKVIKFRRNRRYPLFLQFCEIFDHSIATDK